MKALIYKIRNIVNNKLYIGYTENIKRRLNEHFNRKRKTSEKNILLYKAIEKYGKENFVVEVIYESDDTDHTLNIMEPIFIHIYNSHYLDGHGYNMRYGGESGKGMKHTDETKKLCSLASKGRVFTEEHKRKIGEKQTGVLNHRYGKHCSEEHKKAIAQKLKGKPAKWAEDPEKRKYVGECASARLKLKNNGAEATKIEYIITHEDGRQYKIKGITEYCKKTGYSRGSLKAMLYNGQKKHKDIIKIERLG